MATNAYNTTLLQLVQRFCQEYGLPVPTAVIGSTDSSVLQYKATLTAVVRDLVTRNFQELKARRTFITSNAENQGVIEALLGVDCAYIVQGSIWDETLRRPLFGPTGDATWEMYKAFVNTGPLYQYNIFERQLFINPAPPANHTIGCVVKSNAGIVGASGLLYDFDADTNTFKVDSELVYKGLEYRWKKIKGEPYLEDENAYLTAIATSVGKMANLPTLHLDKSRQNLVPGIWVPAGNWPTT